MGITLINQTEERLRLSRIRSFVKRVLEALKEEKASLSIVFVSPETIRAYNRDFRGVDAYTDVMAFPGDGDYLGDILVCPEVVRENARELDRDFEEELEFVIVHGVLHLLGYSDYTPEEKEEMFKLQNRIIREVKDGTAP